MAAGTRRVWLLALLLLAIGPATRAAAPATAPSPPGRPSLQEKTAVAPLAFVAADPQARYAPLADAIGDMLASRLSRVHRLALVERRAIARVLAEQKLSLALTSAEQVRVGRLVGATLVMTGSVTAVGERLRIVAHLTEVETSRVAQSAQVETEPARISEAIEELAGSLARDLRLELPRLQPGEVDAAPDANLHYMRALSLRLAGMPDEAIAQFMAALALDPRHAPARYWNAVTYFDQGEREHARIELERFLKDFDKDDRAAAARRLLEQCQPKP